jgi:hypothetical protein
MGLLRFSTKWKKSNHERVLFYYIEEQIELWLRRVWGVAFGCTVDNVRTRRLRLIVLGLRRLRLIVLGLRRLCLIISTLFGKVTKIVRDRMKSFLNYSHLSPPLH